MHNWSPNTLGEVDMIDSLSTKAGKIPSANPIPSPAGATTNNETAGNAPTSQATSVNIAISRAKTALRRPIVNLRISERRLVLSAADVMLINLALILGMTATGNFVLTLENILANVKWFITLSVVWLGCANFFDSYSLARAASAFNSVRNTSLSIIATILAYTLLIPLLTPPLASRGAIFVFAGLALFFILTWRIVYAKVFIQPWFEQRALIVGAGNAGRMLATAIQAAPRTDANPYRGTGYQLVGYVDDDVTLHGEGIEQIPVLGDNSRLAELSQTLHVNEIILAITNTQTISDEMMDALLRCREFGMRISTMAMVYERLTGRVPIDYVGRDLQLVLPMHDSAGERAYQLLKRLADIVIASIGLAVMGLSLIPISLINHFTSPGPLFYTQKRVGQGGKLFRMYKFRSMRPDAERNGAQWARKNDDRITPVGKIARKTRLDELPQFINVLKGEMSVIGPRPERPEFVNALALMIPYYRARHAVKPGITGWAQVKYGYGGSREETRIKLEHDLYYVKHASPLLDILIILQTPVTMLLGKGQ